MYVPKKTVQMEATRITLIVVLSRSQATGVLPINMSRKVPPPMDVTKAIISTPKISSRLRMAEDVPLTAKENVPRISMIWKKSKVKRIVAVFAAKVKYSFLRAVHWHGGYLAVCNYRGRRRGGKPTFKSF